MGNEYSLRAPRRWLWLIAVGLALALAALAVPAIRHLREQPPPAAPTLRASWSAPEGLVVGASSEYPFGLALAPDGRRLVFPAGRDGRAQLWLQDLSVGSLAALPGTDGAVLPFWSPDGTRVGFFADASLKVISLDDAQTLFHEFGHALHTLLSEVNYPGLSTTPRDFVEYPSQVHEMWVMTRPVLDRFGVHYKTKKPMPKALVDKVDASKRFN